MPRWSLVWLGAGAVLVIATWWLSRRVASPAARLGLRCLGVAAVLAPQPLWIPGEGGAVVPALLNLLSGHPLFGLTMGAFPIFAVATILFVPLGWRLARAAAGRERLVHQVARRWVVVGLILPLLALALLSPFLAFFALGGPLALWGIASLAILGAAAALDGRAATGTDAVSPRWLGRATWLLGTLVVLVTVALHAWRMRI